MGNIFKNKSSRPDESTARDRKDSASADSELIPENGSYSQEPEKSFMVVAMHTFHRRDGSELSFTKGDKLEIHDGNDEDWWLGTNLRTQEKGYIPVPYVALATSLDSQDWYFGMINRVEAEKLLLSAYNDTGAYLIRISESGHNYSISVRAYNAEMNLPYVKHYRVYGSIETGYSLSKDKFFATLNDLIDNYAYDNGTELSQLLRFPCVRSEPVLRDISVGTVDNWEVPREFLTSWKRRLGKGTFGEVWLCSWNHTADVAVKTMKEGTMSVDQFLEEAKIMKQLRHKNILNLYAVCTREEPILIITEYMEKGSLLEFLRDEGRRVLVFDDFIYMAAQVADAMSYLEAQQLIHRDLAARNVLLKDGLICKVADFGLARIIDGIYNPSTNTKFPVKWTAPEAYMKDVFTIKSDVWSFGILLAEIFTYGEVPYRGYSKQYVVDQVPNGFRMPKPDSCSDEIYELMLYCWNIEPDGRPTFEYIHNFLLNYDAQKGPSYSEATRFFYGGN